MRTPYEEFAAAPDGGAAATTAAQKQSAIPYHARENSLPFSYGQIGKTSTPLRSTLQSSKPATGSVGASASASTSASGCGSGGPNGRMGYGSSGSGADGGYDFGVSVFGSPDRDYYNYYNTKSSTTTTTAAGVGGGGGGGAGTDVKGSNGMLKTQPRLTSPILVRKTLNRSPTRSHSSTNTIANTYHYNYGGSSGPDGGGGGGGGTFSAAGDNYNNRHDSGKSGRSANGLNGLNGNHDFGYNNSSNNMGSTSTLRSSTPTRIDLEELLRERRDKVYSEYRATTHTAAGRQPPQPPQRQWHLTSSLPAARVANGNAVRAPSGTQSRNHNYNYDFEFNLNLDEVDATPRRSATMERSSALQQYRTRNIPLPLDPAAAETTSAFVERNYHTISSSSAAKERPPFEAALPSTLPYNRPYQSQQLLQSQSHQQSQQQSQQQSHQQSQQQSQQQSHQQSHQQSQAQAQQPRWLDLTTYGNENASAYGYNANNNTNSNNNNNKNTNINNNNNTNTNTNNSSSIYNNMYSSSSSEKYEYNRGSLGGRAAGGGGAGGVGGVSAGGGEGVVVRNLNYSFNANNANNAGNSSSNSNSNSNDISAIYATTTKQASRRNPNSNHNNNYNNIGSSNTITTSTYRSTVRATEPESSATDYTSSAFLLGGASMASPSTPTPYASRPETPAFPVTPRTPFGTNNGNGHGNGNGSNTPISHSPHSPVGGHRGGEVQNYSAETIYQTNYRPRLNSSLSVVNGEPQEVAAHLVKFAKDSSKFWYKATLSRDEAISLLLNAAPGTFVVRDSTTYKNAYGLVMRVAQPPPGSSSGKADELVRHFLIEPTTRGVRLKGCANEPVFTSLSALVFEHSINQLALPCLLRIPEQDIVPMAEPTPAQRQLLTQGAACNVLWLYSSETESLTGEEAIRKTIRQLYAHKPLPAPTVVHFKVTQQGITLTDNTRKKFFRKHYSADIISFCAIDPDHRTWTMQDGEEGKSSVGALRKTIFAFVARRSPSSKDNQCHVFCDMAINQPASAIVAFVNKTLPTEKQRNYVL